MHHADRTLAEMQRPGEVREAGGIVRNEHVGAAVVGVRSSPRSATSGSSNGNEPPNPEHIPDSAIS